MLKLEKDLKKELRAVLFGGLQPTLKELGPALKVDREGIPRIVQLIEYDYENFSIVLTLFDDSTMEEEVDFFPMKNEVHLLNVEIAPAAMAELYEVWERRMIKDFKFIGLDRHKSNPLGKTH